MHDARHISSWRPRLRRFALLYLRTLALLSVFVVAMSATYIGIAHARIFPAQDQIVVYGRDSCGITNAFRRALEAQKIPYIYADIDKPLIDQEMWFKVDLPPGKSRVTLPIVQVAGSVLESPDAGKVIALRAARKN